MSELSIDHVVSAELESTFEGGKSLDEAGFSASVADNPMVFALDRAFEALGKPIPTNAGLYGNFRLWLVPHRLAILRRKGHAELTSVGIEVEYLNEGRTCSVVSLFPAPMFVEQGSISVEGSISAAGQVDAEGLTPSPDGPTLDLGDLELRASAGEGLSFRLRTSVVTPIVSAIGIGSPSCQWKFDKDQEALFGRDISAWSVIVLPNGQKTLRYRARYSYTRRSSPFHIRHETRWQEVECQLLDVIPAPATRQDQVMPRVGHATDEARTPRSLRGFAAYASSTRSVQQFLDERREENARESREVEGNPHG